MHSTTVTANPCVDRTIQVDSVNLGHSHRIQKTICDFSGKGINVSLALTQLGMPVKSVCLSHSDGEAADFFKQREMDAELIPVPGNVRINIKLFETSTGCMTEFNEKGTPLHPETAVDVIRAVKNVLPTTSVLILGGSVPPGFPDDFYYELGKSAQEYDVPFILDASGPLLLNGMEAAPVLIKPNEEEYYATFGVHPSVTQEFCASYRQILMEHNIAYGAVSLGEKGALLVTPEAAWYSEPVSVDVKGVQGAGDSMVSGFAYAIAKQHTQGDQLLKMAVSCAHASLELPGTQMCTMSGVEKRFPLTPVKQLCTF